MDFKNPFESNEAGLAKTAQKNIILISSNVISSWSSCFTQDENACYFISNAS